jgi:hypothetical protein
MAGWLPVRRVREIGAGLRRKYPFISAPVGGSRSTRKRGL